MAMKEQTFHVKKQRGNTVLNENSRLSGVIGANY